MANNILKEMIEAGCKVNYFDFSQNNGTINIRIGTDGFKIENSKPKASTPKTATKEEVKKAEVPVSPSSLPSVNTPQEDEEEVVDEEEEEGDVNSQGSSSPPFDMSTNVEELIFDFETYDRLADFVEEYKDELESGDETQVKIYLTKLFNYNAKTGKAKSLTVNKTLLIEEIARVSGQFDQKKFTEKEGESGGIIISFVSED
jgi:hypothetical protein